VTGRAGARARAIAAHARYAALLVLALGAAAERAGGGDPLVFAWRIEDEAPMLGAPVVVLLEAHNPGSEPASLDLGPGRDAYLDCAPEGTSEVAEPRPRPGPRAGFQRTGRVVLGPGERHTEAVLLNKWLRFRRAGSLRVRCQIRHVPESAATLELRLAPRDDARLGALAAALADRVLTGTAAEQLAAAASLAYVESDAALPHLARVLEQGELSVAAPAIGGLRRIGSPAAARELVRLYRDGPADLRAAARAELRVWVHEAERPEVRALIERAFTESEGGVPPPLASGQPGR
jgi:hypothetical protein